MGNEAEHFKEIIPIISSSPFADFGFRDFRSLPCDIFALSEGMLKILILGNFILLQTLLRSCSLDSHQSTLISYRKESTEELKTTHTLLIFFLPSTNWRAYLFPLKA